MSVAVAAWGCECYQAGSPCSMLQTTEVVFLGTVTEDSGEGLGTGPGKMRVDEIFHGLAKETREITVDTDARTSCHWRLEKGKQYLIYAKSVPGADGMVQSGQCSGSFPVRGSERYLNALRSAERGLLPHLAGRVRVTAARGYSDEGAEGVSVVAVSGKTRRETITDGNGEFEFRGLLPGPFHLEWHSNEFFLDKRRVPTKVIEIGTTGCAYQGLWVWPNGRLSGTVRSSDGKPLAGLTVQAFAKNDRGEIETYSPLREAQTDTRGRYELPGIPAGSFAVSVYGEPSDNAKSISLVRGQAREGIDLQLSNPRKPAALRIEMVFADGRPAVGAIVHMADLNGSVRFISEGGENTHILTRPAYIGESFKVTAILSDEGKSYSGESDPILISASDVRARIVLSRPNRFTRP